MNWSYVAGFFDGEGSVRLTQRKVILTIANTNKHVLDEITKFVGYGKVYSDRRKKIKPKWNRAYVYAIQRYRGAFEFLNHILSYLYVKRKVVKLILRELKIRIEKFERETEFRQHVRRKIRKMIKQGHSYRETAKKLRVGRGRVWYAIKNSVPDFKAERKLGFKN